MDINKVLHNLDFSEKETLVYLTILELGSAKVNEIAKKAEINRTTVYDVLEGLVHKGLVSKYKKGQTTFFNVLDPKQLLTYLDREKEEKAKIIAQQKKKVEEIIPELVSLQNIYTDKPKVQMFEGEKGMREAYEDTLSSKDMILAYANVETMHKGLPNFFPEYYKRRAEKKIFIRAIIPVNELSIERSKHDREEMRETRFLPDKEMTFTPEVNLYNNKMLVASWAEKIAIIIESRELVELQKIVFGITWNSLSANRN